MSGEWKRFFYLAAIASLFALFLFRWIAISRNYPYYFIWDMDHVVDVDTVLINSQLLPDHISNTCFGMNFILVLSQKLARALNVLSAISLQDLAQSLNPLAGMAELATFIRRHTPFVEAAIVLALWLTLYLIFHPSRWFMLLTLMLLGTQDCLTYHASMIRTEVYSLFYWSHALLLMTASVKAGRSAISAVGFVVSGVLLGLSFLTKIQSIVYLATFPFLMLFVISCHETGAGGIQASAASKNAFRFVILSLCNGLIFMGLTFASSLTPIPEGFATFAARYGITPVTLVFSAAFLVIFLVLLFLYRKNRSATEWFKAFSLFTLLSSGFLLAFALHFLIYASPRLSLTLLLYDFKILFLREIDEKFIKNPYYVYDPPAFFLYHPVLFLVNLALLLTLLAGSIHKFARITLRQALLCLVLAALALANVYLVLRCLLRDLLWEEVMINFLSLLFFLFLTARAAKFHRLLRIAGGAMLSLAVLVNVIHSHAMPRRIDANYNHYGWDAGVWLKGVYRHNHPLYENLMNKKYGTPLMARVAREASLDQERIRNTVRFVFQNQVITHRNIGIITEGFPVWTADPDYKIASTPPPLRFSTVVDNGELPLKAFPLSKGQYVSQHSEVLDKLWRNPARDLLAVLSRTDLQILLFLQKDDLIKTSGFEMSLTPYTIVLRKGKQDLALTGLQIDNYCELPIKNFSHKFFFVIRRK